MAFAYAQTEEFSERQNNAQVIIRPTWLQTHDIKEGKPWEECEKADFCV